MSRRLLLPLALGALVVGGVPALADANGSTEVKTVDRSCSAPADPKYSAPGPGDCRKADGSFDPGGTYRSQYNSNDVTCGSTNRQAGQSGLNVYAGGDPTTSGGSAGVCQEESTLPIQGRAGVSGSTATGARATVDGDKDNPTPNGNETAQGYVLVEKGPGASAPAYRCGNEYSQGGKADSDSPEAQDTSAECASGS